MSKIVTQDIIDWFEKEVGAAIEEELLRDTPLRKALEEIE